MTAIEWMLLNVPHHIIFYILRVLIRLGLVVVVVVVVANDDI